MTVTIAEKHRGTSGSSESWRVQYTVEATGADASKTEFELAAAVAVIVPDTITDNDGGGLILGDISIDEMYDGTEVTHAIATASYNLAQIGSKLGKANTTPLSELVYEFNYQATSEHIYFALGTRKYGTNAPELGNRIRVRYDGNDLITDGVDLPSGGTTNTWRMTVPRGYVSGLYESRVEGMIGGVNLTTFKGREPGTMRFVSVQSSVSAGASMNIAWGFQYAPNRTGLTIEGISGIEILGHEVWWSLDEKKLDTTAKKMVLQPRAIYVQQVFPAVELNDLGI